MSCQNKFDAMVDILEKYKYKAMVVSELDRVDEYFYLQINSVAQPWLSERFSILHKNRNDKFYFYINLNLHDSGLTKRDTKLMMDFWTEAVKLCDELNKLRVPYIEQYEGETGLINYFKNSYKRMNKRFFVYRV